MSSQQLSSGRPEIPANLSLPKMLNADYRGVRLGMLLDEQGQAQLLVNGLVRASTGLGATGACLVTTAQTGYEEHEHIEGRIRLHQPEGHILELSAGQQLLSRLLA